MHNTPTSAPLANDWHEAARSRALALRGDAMDAVWQRWHAQLSAAGSWLRRSALRKPGRYTGGNTLRLTPRPIASCGG